MLPVTSTTPEHTFFTLKFSKSYLRSTNYEERLNALAMTNINKSGEITKVIQVFSKKSHRRLLFFLGILHSPLPQLKNPGYATALLYDTITFTGVFVVLLTLGREK